MAICQVCNQDMSSVATIDCTRHRVVNFPDGEVLPAVPFTDDHPSEPLSRCHDCNVAIGGFHHPGCDVEVCPRCRGQLISCGCFDDDSDEEVDGIL